MYPLNLVRPNFELKCGIFSLKEKIENIYSEEEIWVLPREEFVDSYANIFDFIADYQADEFLFLNSNLLVKEKISEDIPANTILYVGNSPCGFKLDKKMVTSLNLENFLDDNFYAKCFSNLKKVNLKQVKYVLSPNQLFEENPQEITNDLRFVKDREIPRRCGEFDVIGKEDCLFIKDSATIYPGVIFNTENGPIVIDDGSVVKPFTVIEGPTYIGKNSLIDYAKIREGTSIFDVCKISGEVENSIIMSYTNKHHTGFLGHSYICEWVNFGAMATNSDLKNNYGNVRIVRRGKVEDTQSIKVGCFVGDHTKFGIGSLLNTGSVIGACCNLYFDGKMYPKEVPCFVWGGKQPFSEYDFGKFIANTEKVLNRRKKELKEKDINLLRKIFENTENQRKTFIGKNI